MAYIIKSKRNKANVDATKLSSRSNHGYSIGKNRFLTIMDSQLDENLRKSSKPLFWLVSYLFQTGNYATNQSIANGKTWGQKLYDWFSWTSIVAFLVLLITGVAKPFVKATKAITDGKGDGFGKELGNAFKEPGNIVLLALAAFFLIVSVLYLVLVFKIKKNNSKLSLDAFVAKKLSFCLKFKFLIRFKKNSLKMIDENDQDALILDNFETFGDNDKWVFLQMYNLMAAIFVDLKFSLSFTEYDPVKLDFLYEVVKWDFKNIEIIEVESDAMKAFELRSKEPIPFDRRELEQIKKEQAKAKQN